MTEPAPDDDLARFEAARPRLFAIAYRMLGSISDAEDIVQDAWLRWRRATEAEPDGVRAPAAYLAQVVTRLSIDRLRQLRRRREQYVGTWLPEPLDAAPPTQAALPDASALTALGESLQLSFLFLLESLGPIERAVFLLREAFDYDYDEIAAIVHKRPDNCRQIFARARKHLARDRPHEPPRSPAPHDVAREFMEAIITRDRGRLESLLAADVVFYSDGGGQVPAAINPILGPERVARFLLGVTRKQDPAIVTEPALINGQLGFVSWLGDAPYAATVLEFDGAVIRRLHSVRNPEKLTALRRTIAG